MAVTNFLGVPFFEFCVYVSDTPPSNLPIFSGTTITKLFFFGTMPGAVLGGRVQVRQTNPVIVLIGDFLNVNRYGFSFNA